MNASPQVLIQRGAQRFGPYAPHEIVAHHGERRLFPTDLAWHEGLAAWEPLGGLMARLGYPLPHISANHAPTWLVPAGYSGWAMAAGYCGLLGLLCGLLAPPALIFGIIALVSLKKHPELKGHGRAWLGIAAGAFSLLLFAAALVMILQNVK